MLRIISHLRVGVLEGGVAATAANAFFSNSQLQPFLSKGPWRLLPNLGISSLLIRFISLRCRGVCLNANTAHSHKAFRSSQIYTRLLKVSGLMHFFGEAWLSAMQL